MVVKAQIKGSKTIRIYAPSIESKWNAFHIHAKALGKQPGHLLGEIFEKYFTDNLREISQDCQNHVNAELIPEVSNEQ
tara:strand:+ start:579 stop:812 length:234 start_codon:yes stop_codon:yes gene_type:complete